MSLIKALKVLENTVETVLKLGPLYKPSLVKTFFPRLDWIERYDPQYVEDVEESFRNVREYVDKYVVPNAIEYHKKAEEDRYFYDKDPKYWELMKTGGLLRRGKEDYYQMLGLWPELFGGPGLGAMATTFAAIDEMSAGCAGFSVAFNDHWLGLLPIILTARYDIIYDILAEERNGEIAYVAYAITDTTGGSDAEDADFYNMAKEFSLDVEKVEGGYVLNGTRQFTSNGYIAKYITVLGHLDHKRPDETSCFFFVPTDSEGFSCGRNEEKMGQRFYPTTVTNFDHVFVPDEYLLGPVGTGFYTGGTVTLAASRAGVAAIGTGIARGVYERFLEYARETEINGHKLIDENDIQMALGTWQREIHMARQGYMDSCGLLDSVFIGILEPLKLIPESMNSMIREVLFDPVVQPILSSILHKIMGSNACKGLIDKVWYDYVMPEDMVERLLGYSSSAKPFAGDMAVRIATEALNLMGPRYSTYRQGIEKLLCDAKLNQIYEGTNQVNTIASYKMLCTKQPGRHDTSEVVLK
ncbi:MAG: acyl-CoA dehydrogenase [Candidatus Methanolliviera hydrocarbonicum]|uniref:Acyl-CoA dehydrogenase n=1 Tax=Candidatus Methanolliviera hydrocarbonicum TaxID=2491085 RepID=A0A520KU84_9EURY|nr:MAG: acyl-CoA dehydrogenase [Candidatus Methanolliviera hydrocarbonicum]